MRAEEIRTLFDHLYWVRDQILEAATAAPEIFTEVEPVTIRDLRSTLVHELDVEWSWRERLRGVAFEHWGPDSELKATDYSDLAEVRKHWAEDEAVMRSWLEALSDEEVSGRWTVERPHGQPLWHHLLHIYTHGLQQMSDAAVLLTRAGHSPGELDFLEFIDGRDRPA